MKRKLIPMVVLLLCATAFAEISFTGGDGSSLSKAIIIHARSMASEINAEQNYIAEHFQPGLSVPMQLVQDDKRTLFHVYRFTTSDGKPHTLYFAINPFIVRSRHEDF